MRKMRWREGIACALLPVLIETVLSSRHIGTLLSGGLTDPDSAMRLVRLNDIVSAHAPLHVVARDASGHGTVLHWSHLLDGLLLLLAAPFGWALPPGAALHAAGLLLGPLTLAALGYACAWAVAPFVGRDWRWLAPTAVILAPALWPYGLLGVVHHHVAVVLVAVISWGWGARMVAFPGTSGVALGAWAALGVWLTPETLLVSVLGLGAPFLAWVADGDVLRTRALRGVGLVMVAVTGAAVLVDPPAGGHGAVDIDRLSIVFVGVAMVFAALGCALPLIGRRWSGWPGRLGVATGLGLALSGAWLALFPHAVRGTGVTMSDAEWHAFFDHINEMLPVAGWADILTYLLSGIIAAIVLIGAASRTPTVAGVYGAVCLVGLLLLGQSHQRFAAYPATAAALLLPLIVAAVQRHVRNPHIQTCVRLGITVAVLVVPLGAMVRASAPANGTAGPSCAQAALPPLLAPFGDAVVLANVNDSPVLLYRTKVRTVGSLYHRDPAGFLRLRAAWRSGPADHPPPEILATEATLVLMCPSPARSLLVQDLPGDTLLDWLNRGQVPIWLREVARDSGSGHILYAITP